jgi:hypothetical protein
VPRPEEKRPLGSSMNRLEDNIKLGLEKILYMKGELIYMRNIHIYHTGKVNTGYWCRDLRKRDHLEDLGIDWRIILNSVFKKYCK